MRVVIELFEIKTLVAERVHEGEAPVLSRHQSLVRQGPAAVKGPPDVFSSSH